MRYKLLWPGLEENNVVGNYGSCRFGVSLLVLNFAVAQPSVDENALTFFNIIVRCVPKIRPEDADSVPIGSLHVVAAFVFVVRVCCQGKNYDRMLLRAPFLRISSDSAQ